MRDLIINNWFEKIKSFPLFVQNVRTFSFHVPSVLVIFRWKWAKVQLLIINLYAIEEIDFNEWQIHADWTRIIITININTKLKVFSATFARHYDMTSFPLKKYIQRRKLMTRFYLSICLRSEWIFVWTRIFTFLFDGCG